MKKKTIIGLVVIVVIAVIAYLFWPRNNMNQTNPQQTIDPTMMMGFGMDTSTSDVVETDKGIVYSGKVVPVDTYYYTKSMEKEFNKVYVEEGELIERDTLLFDYKAENSIDAQIQVLEKDFLNMQQELDDYYTRVENMKGEIAAANPDDKSYYNYLQVELNNAEKKISEIKVQWITAEEKINKLKESKGENKVLSDIGGLIYKVNESTSIDPSSKTGSAYIVLYSNERKVRISVSEFEYNLIKVGQEVDVNVESLGKDYKCIVTAVDTMPNNLESDDTSYYNVDIEIPEEVPYGYSVVVTVPRQ